MAQNASGKIVVVGGGQAAASAISSLRQWGFDGSITLVAEEPVVPYQRPPLSKAYMKGEMEEHRLFLKHMSWYEQNEVELLLDTRASGLDRSARRITLANGGRIDYDNLIVATGARPRTLHVPGVELANVFYLRTLRDVQRIRPEMAPGKRITIVGAGYIGLEAAAVSVQLGLVVTVLEYSTRVLERVTSPVISDYYERQHRAHGVDIRTGARLLRITGSGGKVTGVALGDGSTIGTDIVLVGIGIEPDIALAQSDGIHCQNGIVVDRDARTNDPNVYAAGDCTTRPLVHFDRSGRLESVHNAIEQGRVAAAAILGRPRPAEDCPWFWSDQYDLKLQIAGLSTGYANIIVRGDRDSRSFAVFYLKDGRLIAADAVNSPKEFLFSKKLIVGNARVDAEALADASVPMTAIAVEAGGVRT